MNRTLLALSISLIFASASLQANTLSSDNNALIDNRHPVQIDEQTKLPTFLWAMPENAQATERSSVKKPTHSAIEQAAQKHLKRYAPLYQLDDLARASAKPRQIDHLGDNGYIVSYEQKINGIEVFAQRMNLLLDNALQLTAISGHLAPQVTPASALFNVNAASAIAIAFHDLHQENLSASQLKLHHQKGNYQWYALQTALPPSAAHHLSKPVHIKKVWYPLAKQLEPAYYIELSTQSTATDNARANYAYVISAANGALLSRNNMTHNKSNLAFTYRVWADANTRIPYDSPFDNALTPFLTPLKKPITPLVSNLLTLTCGPISTCDPWLPNQATRTFGNNVKAYADMHKPDGYNQNEIIGKVSAPATFDYDYQFDVNDDEQHIEQLQAAITQAFYTTNFMHDWLYDHGFDEISGNGQKDNFRRGGTGDDPMHVEINDYSGTNNANMFTPLDGEPATMQLFLWTHEKKKLLVTINDKTNNYTVTSASVGAHLFRQNNKKIVLVDDGSTSLFDGSNNGSTTDACQAPLVNAADLVGAIALIDRGECTFAEKAKNAQDAGAIAALIANNRAEAMIAMGESGIPEIDNAITIPILGIDQTVGTMIKQALPNTTVTAMMSIKSLPSYNSALDNSIVIHEWGHFLSQRLVWLDNNQGSSLGEGWSDFLALIAMTKEQDRNLVGNIQFQAPYSIGQYSAADQINTYPLGIRRYPYSTKFDTNPLTFKHISNGVALPANIAAAPGTDMSGSNNAEVHNSGEVWAAMLWDAYTGLLNDTNRLTFNEAQNRMLDYLVASLKMTPANPTFLEARDALLVVAKAHDLADYQIFWQAFAKRGAGIDAKAPKHYSKTHKGVVEDFNTP